MKGAIRRGDLGVFLLEMAFARGFGGKGFPVAGTFHIVGADPTLPYRNSRDRRDGVMMGRKHQSVGCTGNEEILLEFGSKN